MTDVPVLDAAELRVLGSLLEKEITVPAAYPMTLNAVRVACNQSTSREPVVEYDDELVHRTLRALKDKDLVVLTWQAGSRVVKYAQTFAQRRGLAADERALLTVLLLRGPQPAGALKTRTERLHPFADRDEVHACLTRMAGAEVPLVRELARQPGQQDTRWIHLLGPVAAVAAAPATVPADRESVLADGPDARDEKIRAAYTAVAAAYADQFDDELDSLPFESWLLHRVAGLAGAAPVIEVGTGPGHGAAFLARAGAADVTGLDLSPGMVEEARRRHPGVTYQVGDLRQLLRPATHDGWGAVLAWYSLVHLAASELPDAVTSLVRPLRPGGWLVLALHAGAEVRTITEWFGHEVDLAFVLHEPADVVALVERAGLRDLEWYLRGPLTWRGETTQRLYVLARKP